MSQPKETTFFSSKKLHSRGEDWYESEYFGHHKGEKMVGDATPAYANRDYHSGTPQKVARYNPEMKLVYIVRHPAKRTQSAWQMFYTSILQGNSVALPELNECTMKGFDSFISNPISFKRQVSVNRYAYQEDAWLAEFPKEQLHIMFLEDLIADQDKEVRGLCQFLELDPDPLVSAELKNMNTKDEKRVPSPLNRFLNGNPIGRVLRMCIPQWIRSRSGKIASTPAQIPKAVWPDDVKKRFREELSNDIAVFLARHNKPSDFYEL